jgi:hypothetical protein
MRPTKPRERACQAIFSSRTTPSPSAVARFSSHPRALSRYRTDIPVMIVCGEAHNYVPKSENVAYRSGSPSSWLANDPLKFPTRSSLNAATSSPCGSPTVTIKPMFATCCPTKSINWLLVRMGAGGGCYSGIETMRKLGPDSLHIVIIYAASGGFFGMPRASRIAARGAGIKFHQWPAAIEDQIWQ